MSHSIQNFASLLPPSLIEHVVMPEALSTVLSKSEFDLSRSNDLLPIETQRKICVISAETHKAIIRLQLLMQAQESQTLRLRTESSSLKKIPPELLGEIFVSYGEGKTQLPSWKRDRNIWKLGHVCTRWRQVLWSTPDIWDNIIFQGPQSMGDLLGFSYILSRRCTPFSLRVDDGWIADTASVLGLLLPHTRGLKRLELHGLKLDLLHVLLRLPSGSFDCLELIKIQVDDYDSDDGTGPPIPNFQSISLQSASNLRTVHFGGNHLFLPYLLLLPFASLNDLGISDMSIPPIIVHNILSQCHSLVRCNIGIIGGPTSSTLSDPITLLHLQHITFVSSAIRPLDWNAFLYPLITPVLQDLCIVDNSRYPMSPCRGVTSLIHRSKCSVKSLKLNMKYSETTFEDSSIEPFLMAFPEMARLDIHAVVPPCVFRTMAMAGIVPALSQLTCRVRPEGLAASLDFLERSYREGTLARPALHVDILCYEGPGDVEYGTKFFELESVLCQVGVGMTLYWVT